MSRDPSERDEEQPIVTDKRRIDPETGQVRESAPAAEPGQADAPADGVGDGDLLDASLTDLEVGLASDLEALQADLTERTNDLQRLHAEYANYRKRVDRDRELVREQAVASALADLLPVLDDIARAREHGELEGGFKAVADSLESAIAKAGVEAFGVEGDPFDPNLHEALMHEHSVDVAVPTCVKVFRQGYRKGERILRPAQVVVADPE